ncbi:MAG: hypothetical protein ACE5NW_14510 [Acidiferrobacterales bacterium]
MKRMSYMILGATILAGTLAFGPAPTAQAATPVAALTANFDQEGTIDRLDLKRSEIVVDDNYFVLSSRLRVYAGDGRPVSAKVLKQGMTIGFTASRDGSGQQSIFEILIVPAK